MKEKKPQPRIELPLENSERNTRPLKNPLRADDLVVKLHSEYMRRLEQARLNEVSNGNLANDTSGKPKE